MITQLQAVLLGAVEGATEFLPVSSTAHLVIAAKLLGIEQTGFTKTFEIGIQGGAILAVLALYFRKFLDVSILKKILIAFIPTGVIGLLAYPLVKHFLIGNFALTLWVLAVGGAGLIAFEYFFKGSEGKKEISQLTIPTLLALGFFQALAIVPGVSRAAATIIGGMLLGVRRSAMVEFSFLLAVPTLLAATGLDVVKNYHSFSSAEFSVFAIGFIASFVFALLSIRFFLSIMRQRSFALFGTYRIALVAALTFWSK